MDYVTTLLEQVQALHWTEWFATGASLLYLVLATRENPWCWFWGILGCTAWAYAAYFQYDLYIDALLQLFYVGISFLGIYQWKFGSKNRQELPITRLRPRAHLEIIGGGLALSFLVGYFFDQYTAAAATYLDALTTVFSIIITFMVIQKKLENWLYWLVIDGLYVYLYGSRGGYLFVVLFLLYLVIVVFGYRQWKRQYAAALAGKG